ncbi:sugar phosphate isomerase/epimerase [Methanohalophilus levihalophilus]|uniref:sugar phosphate isomerase/epimerase family protein n=1 Tax=Methanohalophilus levihalophilus TaxID=1431282 RepID=UPI001AE7CB52|nr:sugar phosphate isomerase/epimerase family protein [Methanohalophilus levihalophilus]MBP2030760.1 sugar phosphate isomerase/epimerase [Methanohalophilus levihalophilus]
MIGASSFAASLSVLDEHVDSVELYIPKLNVYNIDELIREAIESIIDELSTCNLETSIHAPYFADTPNYPSEIVVDLSAMKKLHFRLMEESIELASELGSRAVVIHPGRIHTDREHSFRKMIENLKHLADFAQDRNVVLGLENKEGTDAENLCCDYSELLRAVNAVDSPALGVTFDVGHANLTCRGDQGLLNHFARQLSEHVVHVHLHDNHGCWTDEYCGDIHMAPGGGCIDYSVLKELRGFKGIYNLEVFSLEDVLEGKKALKRIL